nr:MAG TPA: hypothetical protein [Bacteriophage sp.]
MHLALPHVINSLTTVDKWSLRIYIFSAVGVLITPILPTKCELVRKQRSIH